MYTYALRDGGGEQVLVMSTTTKRQRTCSIGADDLARAGEERYIPSEGGGWLVRHGSSLSLMSACGTLLNAHFAATQPTDDYAKRVRRSAARHQRKSRALSEKRQLTVRPG